MADATGMYVSPGLIDIHAHVYYGTDPDANLGNGMSSLPSDGFTFRSGVTTAVDAGRQRLENIQALQGAG